MSVTIGLHLPCIDQGIGFYKEHLAQNLSEAYYYYNNVTVTSKRGCKHSDCMSMYMQTLLKQLKMTVMYDLIGARGEGGHNLGHNNVILGK